MTGRATKNAPRHSEFRLRPATEADLEILADQRVSMWREISPGFVFDHSGYKKTFRAWALRMMRRKKLFPFLVTDARGLPVAGGSIWIREHHPSPRYKGTEQPYLMSMYTDPAYRGKGLATLIVKKAISWSRSRGYPRLSLHASEMGEPVYAKLGFERTTEMRLNLAGPPGGQPPQRSGRGTGPKRNSAPSFIKRADSHRPKAR